MLHEDCKNIFIYPSAFKHIPEYCGSCWAQGTVSALADRFIINDRVEYANLALSSQVLLNCDSMGTCQGGHPSKVYPFAQHIGVIMFFLTRISCNIIPCHSRFQIPHARHMKLTPVVIMKLAMNQEIFKSVEIVPGLFHSRMSNQTVGHKRVSRGTLSVSMAM